MEYIDYAEADAYEAQGFSEIDEKGVTHKVEWEMAQFGPEVEYETWWCKTHDRIYYGGCNQTDNPNGN